MPDHILAIDQGTTSTRAIVFEDGDCLAMGQEEFPQHFPRNGWVEHDPEDLWRSTLRTCEAALAQARLKAGDIAAIGITNQRETTLVWRRDTGETVYPAIVWQDRRTSAWCEDLQRRLEAEGRGTLIRDRTGLLADPYFSASKIRWILDNVPGAAADARKGKLAFGTVDSFLLWRLTGGARHCTDVSNAARTLLFDIRAQRWDEELLELFGVPASMLPEVLDNAADFGATRTELLGAPLPVTGMAGDQQAAAFGQCCFEPGMAKSTYGTGAFLLLNTGEHILQSENRLLTTIAYRLGGRTAYALEGSIFMAGATLQWLRDGLGLIKHAAESESMGFETGEDLSVILVPAFTGLGAPWWDPRARGAIFGLTRDTGIRELVTAALQSVCFQTRDLQEAMAADGRRPTALRVDGGMTRNAFLLQNLADLLGCRVERPAIIQTTALGAACLAGLHCGIYDSLESLAARWRLDASFSPRRDEAWRDARYAAWRDAVARTRSGALA